MIIRELITRLGFDTDERAVRSYEQQMRGLRNTLVAVTAAATAVAGALTTIAAQTARAGDEVAKTAREFGVGTRELQQYRFAMDRLGVSEGEATAGMQRLSRSIGQARQGTGPAASTFDRLGISLDNADGSARSMSELLPDLSDAFAGVDDASERAALSQEIFGRSGGRMASALAAGGDELRDLMARFDTLGGGISEEGTANAEAFTDALTDMRTGISGLRFMIGEMLMPAITDIVNGVVDWYVANRDLVRQNLARVVEVLVNALRALWGMISTVLGAINTVVQAFGGWESVLRLAASALMALVAIKAAGFFIALGAAALAAGGAMALLRIAMLKIPFFAILAGLALIIDDLWRWVEGNESVVGRLLGTWEDFRDRWAQSLSRITALFGEWRDGLSDLLSGVIDLISGILTGDFVRAWDGIVGIWEGSVATLAAVFDIIGEALTAVWETIIAPILDKMGVLDAVEEAWRDLVAIFGDVFAAIDDILSAAVAQIEAAVRLIAALFRGDMSSALDAAADLWGAFGDGIEAAMNAVSAAVRLAWDGVIAPILEKMGALDAVEEAWRALSTVFSDVVDGIDGILQALVDQVGAAIDLIVALFQGDMGDALRAAEALWETTRGVIAAVIDAIGSALESVWDNIIAPVLGKLGDLTGIEAAWNALRGVFDSVLGAIGSAFDAVWQRIKPVYEALRWVMSNGAAAASGISAAGEGSDMQSAVRGQLEAEGLSQGSSEWQMRENELIDQWVRQNMPARESGGFVNAGQGYRINERGEEFLFPDRSGYIATHRAVQSMLAGLQEARRLMAGMNIGSMASAMQGLGGMTQPAQMMPAMAGGNQTFSPTVNMQLPPGTPESQAQYLREQAEPMFRQMLQSEFRRAALAFPRSE